MQHRMVWDLNSLVPKKNTMPGSFTFHYFPIYLSISSWFVIFYCESSPQIRHHRPDITQRDKVFAPGMSEGAGGVEAHTFHNSAASLGSNCTGKCRACEWDQVLRSGDGKLNSQGMHFQMGL